MAIHATAVPTTNGASTGELGAYATAATRGIGFTKSFTEHCVILGFISARADITYQQGMDRMWSRSTRYDFYWPALSHLGEQVVKNKEIYAQGSGDLVADEAAWGYQERYAEYRYKPNLLTGHMRSDAPISLDVWHLAQDLVSPALNAAFIEENPPINRVLLVNGDIQFLMDAYFQYRCARPMPTYSVPGMMDHF